MDRVRVLRWDGGRPVAKGKRWTRARVSVLRHRKLRADSVRETEWLEPWPASKYQRGYET